MRVFGLTNAILSLLPKTVFLQTYQSIICKSGNTVRLPSTDEELFIAQNDWVFLLHKFVKILY